MAIKNLKIMFCLFTILYYSGNTYASVEIKSFPPEIKRESPLEYAWAACNSLGNDCFVIIWIRGTQQDTRIIINGTVKDNNCYVEIPADIFEQYFKYAVLAGLETFDSGYIKAMFGGGPAGGRDIYWFEWSTNVRPSFYCVLR